MKLLHSEAKQTQPAVSFASDTDSRPEHDSRHDTLLFGDRGEELGVMGRAGVAPIDTDRLTGLYDCGQ